MVCIQWSSVYIMMCLDFDKQNYRLDTNVFFYVSVAMNAKQSFLTHIEMQILPTNILQN